MEKFQESSQLPPQPNWWRNLIGPPKQRKYSKKQLFHYWSFWSIGGVLGGCAVGLISFGRRRTYRRWVLKQPKEKQIEIMTTHQSQSLPTKAKAVIPKSRYSTLPKSMDTRPVLPYSGDWRPSMWWELGPLKYWNNRSLYPWASELLTEVGKWSARLALIIAVPLAFECGIVGIATSYLSDYYYLELGNHIPIRTFCGCISGFMLARIASEGLLFYYQSIGMGLTLGFAYAAMTYIDPHWYAIADHNKTVAALYLPFINKAYERREKSKRDIKTITYYENNLRKQALLEAIKENPEMVHSLSTGDRMLLMFDWTKKLDDDAIADAERMAAESGISSASSMDVIDPALLSSEQRTKIANKRFSDYMAINHDSFPHKYFRKEAPQWFIYHHDQAADVEDVTESVSFQSTYSDNRQYQRQHNSVFALA